MQILVAFSILHLGWVVAVPPPTIRFTLVNAKSGDIIGLLGNDTVVDRSLTGHRLTVTVEHTMEADAVQEVQFWYNDSFASTERLPPFALGGDRNEQFIPVRELSRLGLHNITAVVLTTSGQSIKDSVEFTVAKTAMPTTLSGYKYGPAGVLTGELRKWHCVTIGFEGPETSETSMPNPFTFYRLDVHFVHISGASEYSVPGFYAADGNAAQTGASSGNVWLVHFSPDMVGKWNWSASFVEGESIATSDGNGTSAGFFDNCTGSFVVEPTNKTGLDLRGKGRLEYVGEHHQRFAETGEWFFKVGSDSPENLLSYDDFDGTPNNLGLRKSWALHVQDYKIGDPTWHGNKGKGLIGVINYLSDMGMLSYSLITLSIDGDDRNIFPYISDNREDFDRFDVSKLGQWDIIFQHASHKGMYLHCKHQEHENDQLLDNGRLGNLRKLYYRELIARFSYLLALNWNLGEENTNTIVSVQSYSDYFQKTDPYGHTVVLHTYPAHKERYFTPMLGRESFDGVSLQSFRWTVFDETLEWLRKSSAAGRKWIVANDEQNPAGVGVLPDKVDFNHTLVRKDVLWGNLMAGGSGVEFYFGSKHEETDLNAQDMRSRHQMWIQARHALDFLHNFAVPFWRMSNYQSIVSFHDNTGSNGGRNSHYWCLMTNKGHDSNATSTIVVYLRRGDKVDIDLYADAADETDADTCATGYLVQWFNPLVGGQLESGSIAVIASLPGKQFLGTPPHSNDGEDWVVLLRCKP